MPPKLQEDKLESMFWTWIASPNLSYVAREHHVSRPTVREAKRRGRWVERRRAMSDAMLKAAVGSLEGLREKALAIAQALVNDYASRVETGDEKISDPWQFVHVAKMMMALRGDVVGGMEGGLLTLPSGKTLDEASVADLVEEQIRLREEAERDERRLAKVEGDKGIAGAIEGREVAIEAEFHVEHGGNGTGEES